MGQTIIRPKQSRFVAFHETLQIRGYASYDDYLRSDEWAEFKKWYFRSGLPKGCLVCKSRDVVLHHWNYRHAGHEEPCDVIPLCEEHHTQLHSWLLDNGNDVRDVPTHLVKCFGFSRDMATLAFSPFVARRRASERLDELKPCGKCGKKIPRSSQADWCWACIKKWKQAAKANPAPKPTPVKTEVCQICRKHRRAGTVSAVKGCLICQKRAIRAADNAAKKLAEERTGYTPLVRRGPHA